jgi:hypothetical protein
MPYQIAISAFLSRLSKHLALLVCLLVLSLGSDRSAIDPAWILALSAVSAAIHLAAGALARAAYHAARPDDR